MQIYIQVSDEIILILSNIDTILPYFIIVISNYGIYCIFNIDMKALPFRIPKNSENKITSEAYKNAHFYDTYHKHPEIQITLIIKSSGTLVLGDYIGDFRPGDIYIIGSNVPHVFRNDSDYYQVNSNLEAQSISLFFDEHLFGPNFLTLPETQPIEYLLQQSKKGLKIHGKLKEQLSGLILEFQVKAGFDRIICLFNLLNALCKSDQYEALTTKIINIKVGEREGKRLNDIFQFTMAHYQEEIALDKIAEVANLSVTSFCRYFKQRTLKTYINFLNEVRISNACMMLRNNKYTVFQICYRTGFNNLSNFNRNFKRITGHTPTEYARISR